MDTGGGREDGSLSFMKAVFSPYCFLTALNKAFALLEPSADIKSQ